MTRAGITALVIQRLTVDERIIMDLGALGQWSGELSW